MFATTTKLLSVKPPKLTTKDLINFFLRYSQPEHLNSTTTLTRSRLPLIATPQSIRLNLTKSKNTTSLTSLIHSTSIHVPRLKPPIISSKRLIATLPLPRRTALTRITPNDRPSTSPITHKLSLNNKTTPLTTSYRIFSTRERLRSIVRGRYLTWKRKKDEKIYNQSRIVFFGWFRLGPEPVRRITSKDIRSPKDWQNYAESTTKWEKIKDSMAAEGFKTTVYTRSIVMAMLGIGFAVAIGLEVYFKPTSTPGWFEGSLAPDLRERLRTEIYPQIGWTNFVEGSDGDVQLREQQLLSGRDGGMVKMQIDPKETPLLAQTTPDHLAVLVYHDEYAQSDRSLNQKAQVNVKKVEIGTKTPVQVTPQQDDTTSLNGPVITNMKDMFKTQIIVQTPINDSIFGPSTTPLTESSSQSLTPPLDPSSQTKKHTTSSNSDSDVYYCPPDSTQPEVVPDPVDDQVPVEVLIGLNNPKEYLSTYLQHLPVTVSFPNQKQINEATKMLLRLPQIPAMPTKEANAAYTDKELLTVDRIYDLNRSKLALIEEILGTNKILVASVRDEIDELYNAELALKEREKMDKLGLLHQLRRHGVLPSPYRGWLMTKFHTATGRIEKELNEAINDEGFMMIYEDWKSVNRPLPKGAVDYSKHALFDPEKSIFSAQRWAETLKFSPRHDIPLPLHGTGRFEGQFNIAMKGFYRQKLREKVEYMSGLEKGSLGDKEAQKSTNNDFYHQHLTKDNKEATGSIDYDLSFVDFDDEEYDSI